MLYLGTADDSNIGAHLTGTYILDQVVSASL